jgi:hypothetical protein
MSDARTRLAATFRGPKASRCSASFTFARGRGCRFLHLRPRARVPGGRGCSPEGELPATGAASEEVTGIVQTRLSQSRSVRRFRGWTVGPEGLTASPAAEASGSENRGSRIRFRVPPSQQAGWVTLHVRSSSAVDSGSTEVVLSSTVSLVRVAPSTEVGGADAPLRW